MVTTETRAQFRRLTASQVSEDGIAHNNYSEEIAAKAELDNFATN
jgi:hypothetical protein